MGYSLRRSDADTQAFSLEGYRPTGERLQPEDVVTEADLPIDCKRVPGTQRLYRVPAYKDEEEKIEAWVTFAQWSWQGCLVEHEKRRKAEYLERPPRRKVPRGLPLSSLRPAETEAEMEVAMLGPSGQLVVPRDAEDASLDFLLK